MSEDLDLSRVGIDWWLDMLAYKRAQLLGTNDVPKPRNDVPKPRSPRDDALELASIEERRFREKVDDLVAKKLHAAHVLAGTDEYVASDGTPVQLGRRLTREDRRAYLDGKSIAGFETRDA